MRQVVPLSPVNLTPGNSAKAEEHLVVSSTGLLLFLAALYFTFPNLVTRPILYAWKRHWISGTTAMRTVVALQKPAAFIAQSSLSYSVWMYGVSNPTVEITEPIYVPTPSTPPVAPAPPGE